MLDVRTLLECDDLTVSDVRCSHGRGSATEPEVASAHRVVFVRRGCFARRADGVERTLDPTLAYCMRPGEEQHYRHPHDGGDDCTTIALSDAAVGDVARADGLPSGTIRVDPALDLAHRMLLAQVRRGDDAHAAYEAAVLLVARALRGAEPPPGPAARRRLVAGAREALAEDGDRSLPELARLLAVSPHHLSRAFRAETGHTVSRHRMRLRARAALERLAEGERELARLAADLGFADQSHLCRVIRAETGDTPGALRAALTAKEQVSGAPSV